ncbi:MAG: hypothetical protein HYS63_04450 [Methylocystis sp.]|nr:hypothetical protein [Methylocystis sp.]
MFRSLLFRALAVALSVGLYLALAIFGAGGIEAYFANSAQFVMRQSVQGTHHEA